MLIQERKLAHLRICARMDVEFRDKTTWLEDVHLVHCALSELSLEDIDTRARFMGKPLRAPLLVGAMSGGAQAAKGLNRDLARVAQELGLGFCLGSQRPMLEGRASASTYAVRRYAPDILILGNIGIQQAAGSDPADIEALADDVGADGLAVHLNSAQELSQAEGDTRFPDGFRVLRALTRRMPARIMVKETGCGISREVGLRLKAAGVRTLDVAGAGGTSWPRVESLRRGGQAAERSWIDEWGIPTAASLLEVSPLGFEIVGSGGVRSGLDAAKCLVLGADVCGLALPVLRAYMRGGLGGARGYLQRVIRELKAVMLLVGAGDVSALKRRRPVITGRLNEWMTRRRSRS